MKENIDISVIIPYYNSHQFINDAIQSVESYQGKYIYEIIIINDGSEEPEAIKALEVIENNGKYTVLHQNNKGPAAARNTGCKKAKGEFLLFLDSDNYIDPNYITVGIDRMVAQKEIVVVYANPIFVGDISGKKGQFIAKPFDIMALLKKNYIDTCAVVRKVAWESVNGFDEEPALISYEDWEFWISIFKADWKFDYVNKDLYYYRVRKDSLVRIKGGGELHRARVNYIFTKHASLLFKHYKKAYNGYAQYQVDKRNPFRSFLKYLYLKFKV